MVKKQNRRTKEKYPALKQNLNLKTRYELVDYDYVDQLSDKEKDWLNRFTEEYTHAKYDHEGKIIDKTKSPSVYDEKGKIVEKSKTAKNQSYDRNNARNRCILTLAKAMGKAHGLEILKFAEGTLNPEEALMMEEKLRMVLSDDKLMKKVKNKKLVEDLRQRLYELELMKRDFQSSNNDTDNS